MRYRWMPAVIAGAVLFSVGSITSAWADEPGAAAGQQETTVQAGATGQETPPAQAGATGQETPPAQADTAGQETAGGWIEGESGWQYQKEDQTLAKNCWLKIGGYWYHFDREGYMAVGWVKIGGYYYCFEENGDLAIGWRYNEDTEKWYYFNEDGTSQKDWFYKDGEWYWFTSRGDMVHSGYRVIDNVRYYFYDDGRLAYNQYVGTFYMDDNGQHDKTHDMVVEGKSRDATVSTEVRDQITEAMKYVPRGWIKYLVEHGWEFLYYPDRSYFSAPSSGSEVYYVYHKLDTSYRKIKFCKPEALAEVCGEYIGYAAGCYEKDSQFMVDLAMNRGNVDQFIDVPDYYLDDMQFYFGKLAEAYLDEEIRPLMEEDSPEVCRLLKEILYQKDAKTDQGGQTAQAAQGAWIAANKTIKVRTPFSGNYWRKGFSTSNRMLMKSFIYLVRYKSLRWQM